MVEGCDSIIEFEFILFVFFEFIMVEVVLCEGVIYSIGDIILIELGIYDLVFIFVVGCDSMVMFVLVGIFVFKFFVVLDSYLYL